MTQETSALSANAISMNQINLAWTDNSNVETGFKIERKTGSGGSYSQIATTGANVTTLQNTGLSAGTQYYYRIRANNTAGDSTFSNEANAMTPSGPPPTAPSGLTATVMSSREIRLAWVDNSIGENMFKIERKTGSGGTWSQIAIANPNATSYRNISLPASTSFYYRVKANNTNGDSAPSNEANASTPAETPNTPGNLWVGTSQQTVGSRLYTWIPTRDANIQIQPDGKVKLICPATKTSLSGGNTCNRFVYDENYRELDPTYLTDLFGNGVNLPDGQYAFHIRYARANAGDYAHVDNFVWAMFHEPGVYPTNCAESEMVSFSIEGGSQPGSGSLVIPAEQRRVSFVSSYMYLNDTLVLPPNKDFGVARFANDVTGSVDNVASLDYLFAKKITHMNDIPYSEVRDYFSADRGWRAGRCEVSNFNEQIDVTVQPGQTWQRTIATAASNPAFMIGDWHRHTFNGDLKGCNYWSEDLGGGNLRFNIQNATGSAQTISGNVLVRVVWTPSTAANSTPLGTKFIFLAEFAENGMLSSTGDAFSLVEDSIALYYQRLVNAFGVTSPAQTNVYFDYYHHLYGYGTVGPHLPWATSAECKAYLNSVSGAKGSSYYYSNFASDYRNRGGGVGYLDNPSNLGDQVYSVIYGLETNFVAMPDRKVAGMGWQATDGTPGGITSYGLYYRRKYPNGDIIQRQDTGHPHEIMKARCFFHLLLANSHLLWEAGALFSKNINNFSTWTGGSVPLYWQPTGGSITTWQAGNSNHPQPVASVPGEGGFPTQPQVGEQGAWNGAYLYSQISAVSDRVSTSIKYPVFSYSVSGGAVQNGYNASNNPVSGGLGAEVSRFGVSNPGQNNIVDLYKLKKPIVMVTQGTQGYAVVLKNIWARPTDAVTYTVQVGGTSRTITHTGRQLGVYLFP